MKISINKIKTSPYQRALRPWKVEHILAKIKERGYNISYPITIDKDNVLVDGGHRLEAAKLAGLEELPFVRRPEDVPSIQHRIFCNLDGADTVPDDVFDLAEYCWLKSQEGSTGQQIAEELGWSETNVSHHKGIKEKLCPQAWDIARFNKAWDSASKEEKSLLKEQFNKLNWRLTHLLALLKHLAWEDGDRAIMRDQIKAVRAILARADQPDHRFGRMQKKVTARWVEALAKKLAWHIKLAKHMRDSLVEKVKIRPRIDLLTAVYAGVYGNKPSDANFEKFDRAVKRFNEEALGITLYFDDALQRLPLLPDTSIDLVVTDPPYNVTDHDWDRIGTDEEYLSFTQRWLEAVRPKLAENYHLFLFCDPDYQARIESLLLENGWPLQSRVIWWNRSLPSGRQVVNRFARTWHMVFHCGNHSLNWPPDWDDCRFDVQEYGATGIEYHPTSKPVKLLEHLIAVGSKPTDSVLDPFAGGGSTGQACINVRQRQCVLVENYEEFVENIEKRLKIKREEE